MSASLQVGIAQPDLPGIEDITPPDKSGDFASEDTSAVDSVATDTTRKSTGLDTVITYAAEEVKFTFKPRITYLSGNAKIRYKKMALDAEEIEVRWEENLLYARGVRDTLTGDTGSAPKDTVVWRGLPELDDGTQIIQGEEMVYNLQSKRGRVIRGDTEYEDGYYHGGRIKKVDEDVYNIRSGDYSTCEHDPPHYSFWSRDMKLKIKDKVVARPIVLKFDKTPVAIIPFGVFSARGGRHSGLIVPTYGETSSQGRFFKDLGYYWAPNDYFDARGTLDFYERYGIRFEADSKYALRYKFTGGISGSLINWQEGQSVQQRWDLRFNHRQTLSPTMNLVANGIFLSDGSFQRDVAISQEERLKQEIRSDLSVTKRWAGSPYSASLNLNYSEDLTTGSSRSSLPRLSFSRNSSPLFPAEEGARSDDQQWWNKLYWSYRGRGENRKTVTVIRMPRWDVVEDDSTLKFDEESDSRARSGVQHDLSFSARTDVSYFGVTPRISYTENWYDEWYTYAFDEYGVPDTTKHDGFIARRTFSASFGINTKLYGLFKPRLLGLEALRHTLSPSVSYTYKPDFSELQWGYYDVFTDSIGNKRYYDRFSGNIYGGTPRTEQQAVSLSLGNLFEYKRKKGDEEIKGDLFTLNLGTGHNFAADSLKWSDLRGSFRLKPIGSGGRVKGLIDRFSGVTFTVTGVHSFYDQVEIPPESGEGRSRWITIDESAPRLLRLENIDLNSSFSLSGGSGVKTEIDTGLTKDADDNASPGDKWQPGSLPWEAAFGFRYGENHRDPTNIRKSVWGNATLDLNVSKNWKLTYSTRVDLHNRRVDGANISLYRDMHCWEGRLRWNLLGTGSGFFLKISVKSPHLKDLKVEKREGRSGLFGG